MKLAILLAALALSVSCSQKESESGEAPAAEAPLPPPSPEGTPRRVAITVDNKGYHPDRLPARSGEDLVLVFTRTEENECTRSVVVEGKATELPVGRAVEVALTAPKDGELVFTCGMKMFEGRVTVVD